MDEVKILEGAEGYSLGDGPVGALFCHGFTSSPQNMRLLADHLVERGIAVRAPLLPGHGTTWQDLNTRTRRGLVRSDRGRLPRDWPPSTTRSSSSA